MKYQYVKKLYISIGLVIKVLVAQIKFRRKCVMGNVGNVDACSLTAKMPEPPLAIKELLGDYQDFLSSVFAREYQKQNTTPWSTMPLYMPKLTEEEQNYIENLTYRLKSSPEWKEYSKQWHKWVVLM